MTITETFAVDVEHRKWVAEFTWHLDIVPVLLEVLVDAALPPIPVGGGSVFDKDQITGGGYRDNMQILDRFEVHASGEIGGRLVDQRPAVADAIELWDWLTGYTTGASSWVNQYVTVPYPADLPPAMDRRPNADPLTARGLALVTVGWLIDRADLIAKFDALEPHREEMFALIRRLRGRYGVFNHPRRARPALCGTCGERAVVIDWIDGENGSPKPVRGGKCRNCGEVHRPTEGKTS